jgi:hypothetical protein
MKLKGFSSLEMQFIDVFYIQQNNMSETSEALSMKIEKVRKMKNDMKNRIQEILKGRDKWTSKNIGGNFWDFYEWYVNADKKCYYCNVTQEDLDNLHEIGIINKRQSRGKTLEIDRKIANEEYINIGNLTYSCYWCNNAKTDTFTEKEFLIIGKAVSEVWKNRLKEN